MLLGVLLLAAGGVTWLFFPFEAVAHGLKWGALAGGIFLMIGGYGYRSFSQTLHDRGEVLYNEDRIEFIRSECERMQKVSKGFPKYQFVFSALVVASVATLVFADRPVWQGISLVVLVMFLGVLAIEANSRASITAYTSQLNGES